MTEILYTGDIPVADLPRLIMACRFSAPAWILAERLPDRAAIKTKERKALLQFTYLPTDISTTDDHAGRFFPGDPDSSITDYHTGRVFRANAELRWEKQKGQMHVIYIGSEDYSSLMKDYKLKDKPDVLTSLKKCDEPKYYYLFGERIRPSDLEKMSSTVRPGDFAEVRIPRLLRYPLDSQVSRYARLSVCEYLDTETGEVQLYRFQALEPWE